jgi:ABC-type amino acid transport substrate-binding protein
MFKLGRKAAATCSAVVASGLAVGALGMAANNASAATKTMPGVMTPGTLTVGMDLQFAPEMYLKGGKPAGYDVDLLNLLAKYAGVKLNIQNLAFTGLIPGLQAKKFDMVSVGLSPTPAREKVISFSKPYVPYALVVGVPASKAKSTTKVSQLNQSSMTITSLLGSTDADLAKSTFPNAKQDPLSDQNSAFSLVATGRANAIVAEDYLLAQYSKANPGKIAEANIKPLQVQYGSYGVQKGNTALAGYLNKFLKTECKSGAIAKLYEKDYAVKSFPGLPGCKA